MKLFSKCQFYNIIDFIKNFITFIIINKVGYYSLSLLMNAFIFFRVHCQRLQLFGRGVQLKENDNSCEISKSPLPQFTMISENNS